MSGERAGAGDRAGTVPGRTTPSAHTGIQDDRVRTRLAERIGDGPYRRYFNDGTELAIDDGVLRVSARDQFTADIIGDRFGGALRDLAGEIPGVGRDAVRVDVCRPAQPSEQTTQTTPKSSTRPPRTGKKRPHSVTPTARNIRGSAWRGFDSFVVGDANRVAYTAGWRLAEDGDGWNGPLFVHGDCGQGKTHLLEAIAGRFRQRRPGAKVRIVTGDAFVGQFVASMGANTMKRFRARYRSLDLLCIDDVGIIAGKVKTMIELSHTLDALRSTRGRIVLSSDAEPGSIDAIDAALRSRFNAGVVARLDTPDAPMRRRLVVEFASRRGLPISHAAAVHAADAAPPASSPRDLEGLVVQIEAVWRMQGAAGTIGVVLVDAALASRMGSPRTAMRCGPVAFDVIQRVVCERVGVELSELRGRGRTKRVVLARSLIVLLAKEMTNRSYPEIARAMGRRNHSTTITQMRAIEKRIAAGEVLAAGCSLDGMTIRQAADTLGRAIRGGGA